LRVGSGASESNARTAAGKEASDASALASLKTLEAK
jgi:hypothetical protein